MRICVCCLLIFTACFAFAQGTSREKRDELLGLYQKARGLAIAQEFVQSNDAYKTLLDKLPAATGKIDRDRKQIHYDMAVNFTMSGDSQAALSSLGKAADHGFWDYEYLKRDPSLQLLRSHKGFSKAVERVQRALGSMAFGLETIDDESVREKDYRGKVLIVDIWGTWCPPCRREIPHFIRLRREYGDHGLRIIGLTYEKRPISESLKQSVKGFAQKSGINYPLVLLPPEMRSQIPYLNSFPTTFFMDHKGVVRRVIRGYHDYESLERTVLPLLKAMAKASTQE